MRDQWIEKNIDLSALSKEVEHFFVENQFETKLEETPRGYKIMALSERILDVQLRIEVEILGQPNNFSIEYTTNEGKKGFLSTSLGKYLAWALGGGILVLKDEKVKEALEKFEETFWSYVDEKIALLARP